MKELDLGRGAVNTETRQQIYKVCCYIAKLTQYYEQMIWPGDVIGAFPGIDETVTATAKALNAQRELILDQLIWLVLDTVDDRDPGQAADPAETAGAIAEVLTKQMGAMMEATNDYHRERVEAFEAALKPFAAIYERRGGQHGESVGKSPGACDLNDCRDAWVVLNPDKATFKDKTKDDG